MFFAQQGGDGLEIPAFDVNVLADGTVYEGAIVVFKPQNANVYFDTTSGRTTLRGIVLAAGELPRSSYVCGVALEDGSAGDNVKVRIQGAVKAKVSGTDAVSAGDGLTLSTTTALLAPAGDNSTTGTPASQGFRYLAWVLTGFTPTGGNAVTASKTDVLFNGFGWDSDEYTED